jgi:outer membrane putative beta-barrel porin/alpha-amylase
MRTIFLVGLLLLAAGEAVASCGSSQCSIDAHGTATRSGRFALDVSWQAIDQDQPRIGTERATVGELPGGEDEVRTVNRQVTFRGQAMVGPRWNVSLSLPWVNREHSHVHHDAEGASLQNYHYRGVGDVAVGADWLAWRDGPGSLRLQAGAKLPTGRRHVAAIDGDEPEPPARPGTGSLDVLVGAYYERALPARNPGGAPRWFASTLLRVNGRGTEDYRAGNEAQLNLGASVPLASRVAALGQLNARVRGKDDVGATDAMRDDTGGTWLYASPGLQYRPPGAIAWSLFVQVPVYQRVNRIQLTAPANVYLAVSYGGGR